MFSRCWRARTTFAVALVAVLSLVAQLLVYRLPVASAEPAPPGTAGALDQTFGTNGVATVSVPGLSLIQLSKVLVQTDGKVIVGGIQPGVQGSVTVARLTAAGALDTNFADGRGYVTPGFGSVSTLDGAGIALQPDGRIVVVGSSTQASDADEGTNHNGDADADDGTQVGVARLNTDGSLDSGFGTNGIVVTDLDAAGGLHGTAVAVAPDGHLLVSAFTGATGDFAVLRYTPTGKLDTSFGPAGSGVAFVSPASPSSAPSGPSDLVLQADGKVVVVGSASVSGQSDSAVVRFNANGTLDTTFNVKGWITVDASGSSVGDSAAAVALDPAGRIVVSGSVAGAAPVAYTMRLLANGTRDTSFATNGVLKGTFSGSGTGSGTGPATGGGLAIDAAGRALVAGGDSGSALGIERLLGGASPYDPSFGLAATTGRETIPCAPAPQTFAPAKAATTTPGQGAGTAVAVQPDQRVLLGGDCNGSLVVARLNTGTVANLTMTTTTPTAAAGHPAVPLSSIPPGVLVPNAGAVGSSALRSSAIFGSPFGGGPFGGGPFGGGPFGGGPFGGGPFGGGPFGGGPLEGGAFLSPTLPPITIASIPLLPSASWPQVLAGTTCATMPAQSLTLQFVFANCNTSAVQGLFSGQININSTPLRNTSLMAFSLGLTPASRLPPFCAAVAALRANCTNTDPTTNSLVDYELKGDNLGAYYAATPINLNGLALVNAPLTVSWLGAMQLSDTTLGGILISSLTTPAKFVTCGASCAAGETLAQAQANNQLQPAAGPNGPTGLATLGALLVDSPGVVGPLPLQALMIGMVPRQALPVEQISIADIVANSPLPGAGTAAYQIDFDLGCGAAGPAPGLDVLPVLPAGFRVVPSSARMTVGGTATPVTVGADGAIRPQSAVSCPASGPATTHVTTTLTAEPAAVLGPTTAGATVSTADQTTSVTGQAPVTVVDGTDESPSTATTPPATPLSPDTMYLGHIAAPGDIDYFSLAPQPPGSVVSISLSHLPADYDLVLYGNETPSLRGAPFGGGPFGGGPFGGGPFGGGPFGGGPFGGGPFGGGPLVTDSSTLPTSNGSTTPPEVLQDVPLLPGAPVRAASAQRGTTDESVYTVTTESDTTPLIVQVSGFNGASSAQPYVLRVTVTPPRPALPCAPVSFSGGGTTAALPTTIDPATRTIILVNQKRLGDVYGPALAAQTMAKLNALAAYKDANGNHAFDVNGVVVPVDGDSKVAADYTAWDAGPCSVKAANQIVTDINALVDRLRTGLTDLRYLVVAGSDVIVPFGRVPDGSALLNEREAGPGVSTRGTDNPESAALSAGYLLSDNPYGDLSPSSPSSSPLYVPQLAVGRLVETPADIAASVDQYIASNGVRTPNAAFGTAYDWMQSAGQAVQAALQPQVPGGSTTFLVNNTWTRQDVLTGLKGATGGAGAAHGYVSLNAHSDFSRALPANEFISGTQNPDLITTADLPADVRNSVFLTLGCHAGLNVSDTYIASPTAGEAAALLDWPQAVSRNGGTLQAPTGYGIGDSDALAYSARLLAGFAQNLDGTMSVGQALMFAKQQYFKIGVASVYDAKAIEEATFYGPPMSRLGPAGTVAGSVAPPGPPPPPPPPPGPPPPPPPPPTVTVATSPSSFTTTPTLPAGVTTYYAVGGQAPQVTPNEPVQPRTDIALARRNDGLAAHGDVIEQLTSLDVSGFRPAYDTPVADLTALSKRPPVSTAAFPSKIQTIATTIGPNGPEQSLVLVPGQFSSDSSGTGTGRQRLFNNIGSTVLWSNSTSFVPPTISTVSGSVAANTSTGTTGATATFTATTPNTDVQRGVLLFLAAGGPTAHTWQHVELVNTGNGTWSASVAVPAAMTSIGEFFVQLVDTSGNVGVSSNKANNYSAGTQTSPGAFSFSISPGPDPATGLYPSPTTVTVTGPAGQTFTVTVDGGSPQTFTGSGTVTLSTDGAHVLVVHGQGGTTAVATVPIDTSPPVITVTTPPPPPPGTPPTVYRQGQQVPSHFACTSNITIQSCSGPPFLDTSTPGTHTFTVTASDTFGRTATASVTYTVDGTPPVVTFTQTPPDVTAQTSATFAFTATDPDDAAATLTFTCALDGAAPAPCTSPVTCTGIAPAPAGQHTFTVTAADPAGNTATATFHWIILIPTQVAAEGVVRTVPVLTARLTDTANNPVPGQKMRFTLGFSGGGRQVACEGSGDGSATTGADGRAVCDISVTDLLAVVVNLGYTASFATTTPYSGSQGSAGIL